MLWHRAEGCGKSMSLYADAKSFESTEQVTRSRVLQGAHFHNLFI